MNQVSTIEPQGLSAAVKEAVLGTGDLSKLTVQQRVDYYLWACSTVGVKPSTQPFRFLSFQGSIKLYATRDLTDQLRALHNINVAIVSKELDGELYFVTARATMPNGRSDEDVGGVVIGSLRGEARANAVMKAMTKAKRRVTLSICGLGLMDETEVSSLHGAHTFAHDDPLPVVPIASTAPPPKTIEADTRDDQIASLVEEAEFALNNQPDAQKWLLLLGDYVRRCETMDEVGAIRGFDPVKTAQKKAPPEFRQKMDAIWRESADRLSPQPEPEAVTEEKSAAPPMFETEADPEQADQDEAVIDRVQDEIRGLDNSADLLAWSKGPIRQVMLSLKSRNQAAFDRAVLIIDARSLALAGG